MGARVRRASRRTTFLLCANAFGGWCAELECPCPTGCRTRRLRALLPIVTLALHTGLRRGEIQALRWHQIDFLNRTLTVGASKTEAGTGRVIPLNNRALMTLQTWATNFARRQPEHYAFPSEHYGFAGNERKPHAKTMNPNTPTREVKTAWKGRMSNLASSVASTTSDIPPARGCSNAGLRSRLSRRSWAGVPAPRRRWRSGTGTSARMSSERHSRRSTTRRASAHEWKNPKTLRRPNRPEISEGGHKIGHSDEWSHCGLAKLLRRLVRLAGLEPATSWFVARRSIQLS